MKWFVRKLVLVSIRLLLLTWPPPRHMLLDPTVWCVLEVDPNSLVVRVVLTM